MREEAREKKRLDAGGSKLWKCRAPWPDVKRDLGDQIRGEETKDGAGKTAGLQRIPFWRIQPIV